MRRWDKAQDKRMGAADSALLAKQVRTRKTQKQLLVPLIGMHCFSWNLDLRSSYSVHRTSVLLRFAPEMQGGWESLPAQTLSGAAGQVDPGESLSSSLRLLGTRIHIPGVHYWAHCPADSSQPGWAMKGLSRQRGPEGPMATVMAQFQPKWHFLIATYLCNTYFSL